MTTSLAKEPRRFAPLKDVGGTGAGKGLPILKGIIFDVDGTLWLVGVLSDFDFNIFCMI